MTLAEQVERVVLDHPEGITVEGVAERTGQTYPSTEASLRYARQTRGKIGRTEGGLWVSCEKAPPYPPPPRATIAEQIASVLDGVTAPMKPVEIFAVARESWPEVKLSSIRSILRRMVEQGLVIECDGGRSGLYLPASKDASGETSSEGGAQVTH
jgi:hypothetical protein